MKTYIQLIAVSLCFTACKQTGSSPTVTELPTMQWEYKQTISFSKSFPTEELNKLGTEGWELVSYSEERQTGYYNKFVFKRRINKATPHAE